ncbi:MULTISPECIES: tetratricopeptide repeat protein [Trichocoleus]|uniref:Tetratricopeptide repeat protein n=1 Tax=Trichocoleus desertorum GB2-A4 TaxID=2933944 RepID=A0ABV0J457_9CYAN|nr:tetratricopeptide repeat protein [Trichocoleus sp. FACHB-46]MBD1861908.1 tetratricopeptide repeat protein [Trichocoleus sp. FACHB-46]
MLDTGQLPLSGEPLLWFQQGLLSATQKEYEQAVASYDCVLRVRPDCFDVWYERGLALENLGTYNDAIASYDRALQLQPPKDVACVIWQNRGDAQQYGLGQYADAIASYDRALQVNSEHYQAWQNRGNALLYGFNQYAEAIASYDRALQLKPDYYLAWRNRGNALIELTRYSEAIASYDRALEIEPNDQAASYGRSCALERSGLAYKQPTTNPVWYGRGYSELNPLDEAAIEANETSVFIAHPGTNHTQQQPIFVLEDEQGTREITLEKSSYSIGRDPKSDICLHSQFVSRQHATLLKILRDDGTYIYQIVDGALGGKRSTNGLMINGRKHRAWDLAHDDVVVFGPQVRALYFTSPQPPLDSSPD